MLRTRPRTSKRQFDKMQISFVSLTTIGFSASFSFPSLFRSFLLFSLFPIRRPSSASVPSPAIAFQPVLPLSSVCTFKPSLFFLGYSFFYVLLFNRRSLVCLYQILRVISREQEFTTRKTEVVKMIVCEFQSLYLIDLYSTLSIQKSLTVSVYYMYITSQLQQ